MQDNMMPQNPGMGGGQPQSNIPTITDANLEDFEAKVIHQSMERPVIVDVWAPWCGPCKQLMPVLEGEVNKAGGKVALVKVNLDDNPEIGQALKVQSVPAVFTFFQGRPIDGFAGAQPQSQIAAFVDKAVQAATQAQPGAVDIPQALKDAAQALMDDQLAEAQQIYVQILQQDPNCAAAFAGIARVLIAAGQPDDALEMINNAPDEIAGSDDLEAVKKILELQADAADDGELKLLRDACEKNPEDHDKRIELAKALFASGQKEQAIDELVTSLKIDKDWEEGKARMQLLEFFEALGHADPITVAGRKKLSSVLFS